MATVYVSIGKAGAASNVPVWSGAVASETITSSGTAASGSVESTVPAVAQVVCDTAVYASTTGTASTSNGVYVQAGVAEFIAIQPGETVSVIDV